MNQETEKQDLGDLIKLLLNHAQALKRHHDTGATLKTEGTWILSVAWVRKYANEIIQTFKNALPPRHTT